MLSANIISPQTIDESGRTTSAARSPEEAGEQIMIVAYCNELQIDGQILEFQFDEIVRRKGITAEVLAEFCVDSRAFDVGRREALRRGFAAWLERDHAAAILFLLPQIERAVQTIVKGAGRSALQPLKGNLSMDYKLLSADRSDASSWLECSKPGTAWLAGSMFVGTSSKRQSGPYHAIAGGQDDEY